MLCLGRQGGGGRQVFFREGIIIITLFVQRFYFKWWIEKVQPPNVITLEKRKADRIVKLRNSRKF